MGIIAHRIFHALKGQLTDGLVLSYTRKRCAVLVVVNLQLRSNPTSVILIVLGIAAAWSPTVVATPTAQNVSESKVAVEGLQDTFVFASGEYVSPGTVIVLTSPGGSTLAFVRTSADQDRNDPAQEWRLDGTQIGGPAYWQTVGNLDGVAADGTWQLTVSGAYFSSDTTSGESNRPDLTLTIAGKTIRTGFNIYSPTFNNPQIWNWHVTPTGGTFQDDRPNTRYQEPASSQQYDPMMQPDEDPSEARFYYDAPQAPSVRINNNPDGSTTVYLDQDSDGQKDSGEPGVTTPIAPVGSGLTERVLLHEENVGVGPQPLPPAGTGGVPVPNVPAQPGQPVPDVPSTPGQPVPDHGGAGPVVTPGVGEPVGVLSTRDDGANYCAYFTPEGGSEQLLTCVGRSFLGPLDPSMPRGDTALVFYDPIDVPPTGPVVTPDVPPTPSQPTPDVPPTPGVTTPDVPAVPVGSLGDSPAITFDIDASYSYDDGRLEPLVNVLGQQSWSPIGPSPDDAAWLASPTNAASLTVTVTVYKDGVSQGTVGHSVPALGQVLAAAEKTAGTLP